MLFMSKTFSLSPLSVLTNHEASLSWSQVSLPTIYLATDVHLHYLEAYENVNVVTKKAALAIPPFHEFTGCDTVNTFVTSRNNRSCFHLHALLYDRKSSSLRSTDKAKSSFFEPACIT